ncbi:unnamed protein product [Clonostachys rosea]|uniref:Uncharacterized protein n=1 Tax=Bionectria ochroleuca TaxID=29856 RepID=A0ABY6TZ04_BIOOC|nr:unnamed protein product [Clonostachys rosea]
MAVSPSVSGDASPPSQSPSRSPFPLRQRLWPFSHAKPASSESPQAPVRAPYVPQHAAADFLRTTTPKPRVLPAHEEGSPRRRGDEEKMDDFSRFISQARATEFEHTPRQSARSSQQQEASRQSRSQGGVERVSQKAATT